MRENMSKIIICTNSIIGGYRMKGFLILSFTLFLFCSSSLFAFTYQQMQNLEENGINYNSGYSMNEINNSEIQNAVLKNSSSAKIIDKPEKIFGLGIIVSLDFSSDGNKLLFSGACSKIINTENGELIQILSGHNQHIWRAVFSPNEDKILTASGDKTIKLWNAETGLPEQTYSIHSDIVYCVAFSPDGKKFVSASKDKTAKIFNIETGITEFTLTGHTGSVNSVDFSSDGKLIVTGSSDNTLKLWNAETGVFIRSFNGHSSSVTSVDFSPNNLKIVSGSSDGKAILWDAGTGTKLKVLSGHSYGINAVAYSPDGKTVLTGGGDYNGTDGAKLWNAETGALINTFTGHKIGIFAVTYSADSSRIASGSWDGSVIIRNAETGIILQDFKGHTDIVWSVDYFPDGKSVLSSSRDASAKKWDIVTGKEINNFCCHGGSIYNTAISTDGTEILTGSYDNTAKLWNVDSGAVINTFSGHNGYVRSVAFSRDGSMILTGATDGTAKLWNKNTKTVIKTFSGHSRSVESAVLSYDNSKVLTASEDGTAKIWDVSTGNAIITFSGHTKAVNSAVFSPDENSVLTGSDDMTAKIWSAGSGSLVRTLSGNKYNINSVAFSPDGLKALTGAGGTETDIYSGAELKLWDVQTGEELAVFIGHSYPIDSIAFSPDGNKIVTGSMDRTARLWDISQLLTPTPTPTPTPSPTPEVIYTTTTFDEWTSGSSSLIDAPSFSRNSNELIISSTNHNQFGFWQTTGALRSTVQNSIYFVVTNLRSDAPLCASPIVRIRENSADFSQGDALLINSIGDCSFSPDETSSPYIQVFEPQYDAEGKDFITAVDMLNIDPNDSPSSSLYIDSLIIYRAPKGSLQNSVLLKSYSFDESTEGWKSAGNIKSFTSPVYELSTGTLTMSSLNNINTFGFWSSDPGDITMENNKIYSAEFKIQSAPASVSETAIFRGRLITEDNQASAIINTPLFSNGSVSGKSLNMKSLNVVSREYSIFILTPQLSGSATQKGLSAAIDLININPKAPEKCILSLDELEIYSYDIPFYLY